MPVRSERQFIGRLPKGADLLGFLTQFCVRHNIRLGTISVIGSVVDIHIGYYNQVTKKYLDLIFNDERREIVSFTGNVSLKDDQPYVHGHIVLSDDKGQCLGGHLMAGTKIFAAEYHIQELTGVELARQPDAETGLHLWKVADE